MSTAVRRRWGVRLAGLAAVAVAPLLVTQPAGATMVPQATAGTTSLTLPLFGVPLTVDLTTDAAGSLTNVAVNPADSFTATDLRPNRVQFQNTDGTAVIVVRNHEGRQSVSLRAGSLADISGAGRWSGDVFGSGTPTTVDYVVGADGDGAPTLTGVVSSDATAQVGAVENSQEDNEREAKVQVAFTDGSQRRTLTIKASVETETEDGVTTTKASLKLVLGRVRGVARPAADVAGPHTWSGSLCNGTPASITYTINLDGTISAVTPSPAAASVRGGEHNSEVRFSKWQRVRIHSDLENGLITLEVAERFSCDVTPGTNTTVSTVPGRNDNSDDRGDNRDDRSDNGNDDHGSDDNGNDGNDDGGGDDHGGSSNGDNRGGNGRGGNDD